MKNRIISYVSLLFLIAFLGNACKKDTDFDQIKVPSLQGEQFKKYSWSDQEQQFFSLKKRAFRFAGSRSTNPVVYHPLVIEAYNEIALQNESADFVDSMVVRTGLPLWQQSYIYAHEETKQNLVLIPLGFPNQAHLSGMIAVHQKTEAGTGMNEYVINGMSREELLKTDEGSPHQKRAFSKWMIDYESWLFETEDEDLKDAFCTFSADPKINTDPETDPTDPCVWLILQLCSDDDTQTSWIGGLEHLPLHLDHDRDGIPNSDDQDWAEFTNRTGISQEEFREYVEIWWDENYREEHGEYPDFWDDIYDDFNDPSGGGFWDFFDDIWDGFWGWIDDLFDDWGKGGYGDDLYYDPDYINCPWGDPLNPKTEDRQIRCDWYYVLDCGDEGEHWWDIFSEIVPCPECPGYQDYQDMFRDRLYNYWDNGHMKISFDDLTNLIGNSCNAFAPNFEACAQEIYDAYRLQRISGFIEDFRLDISVQDLWEAASDCNLSGDFSACLSEAYLRGVFLRRYPEITLEPEQEDWLMDHPDKLNEYLNYLNGEPDETDFISYVIYLASIDDPLTFEDLIEMHREFDPDYQNPEPEEIQNGIEIIEMSVPSLSIQAGPRVGRVDYRPGHEHNPPSVIAPDMQYGTNGDRSKLSLINRILYPENSSNERLIADMNVLLQFMSNDIFDPIASKYMAKFTANEGGVYEDADLSEALLANKNLKNSIKAMGEQINDKLKATNGDISNIDFDFESSARPVFSDGDFWQGPKILINDTEYIEVFRQSYSFDPDAGEWEGEFYIVVTDNFGLDDHDLKGFQNKNPSFAAWWLLQHTRNYQPFLTRIRILATLSGKITP